MRWAPEVIGPAECPILHRWTLWPIRDGHEQADVHVKVMVHRFLPRADDRDVHDHPRPFWTLILRGYYDDMRICSECDGARLNPWGSGEPCPICGGEGVELRERMRPGMLRLRPAVHRHRTRVGPDGCWTLVVMGPLRRRWGFWHGGVWRYWREYRAEFGDGMRCD